jgi:uncharacterized tellurite resistance protein B-like protein
MLTALKEFAARLAGFDGSGELKGKDGFNPSELEIATAALLVRAAVINGAIEPSERTMLQTLLMRRYGIEAEEAEELIATALMKEEKAVDLYGFTSVVAQHLGQEGRLELVEMLWEMVYADGTVDEYETNLVWRVAELLGVSTRDRIGLRQQVARRHGA